MDDAVSVCRLLADIVEKVFSGGARKFSEPLMRLARGDVRDHIASSKISGVESNAAAEKSKDRLSRDLKGCSIFDFCNKIPQGADMPVNGRFAPEAVSRRLISFSAKPYQPAEFAKPPVIDQMLRILDARQTSE
jgi:hypothetical protein